VKYYKDTVDLRNRLTFEIRERGPGAGNDVLATTDDSVFADRLVYLLNEDELITRSMAETDVILAQADTLTDEGLERALRRIFPL